MSDNTISPVEGSDGSVEGLTVSPGDTHLSEAPEGSEEHSGSKLHQEAARYRTQLRATEASLAEAQERIDSLVRSDIERVAAEVLSQGSDLFLADADVSRFVGEDGRVDYEAVRAAANGLLSERPRLGRLQQAQDPSFGLGGVGSGKPASWSDLFHG